MDCSNQEAVSLLKGWRDSGSSIHCVFLPKGSRWYLNADAKIYFITPELLTVSFSENAALHVPLSGARFSFADPREAKPESQELMKAKYECSVSIALSTKEWLLLGEYKHD
jgi:hypothetical protein